MEKSRLCLAGCQRVVKREYICYLPVYLVASCRPGRVLTTDALPRPTLTLNTRLAFSVSRSMSLTLLLSCVTCWVPPAGLWYLVFKDMRLLLIAYPLFLCAFSSFLSLVLLLQFHRLDIIVLVDWA